MSPVPNSLSKIEHIVVLMLENRSFDNLLGWLYDPSNDPPYNVVPPNFDGLFGKSLSNPDPSGKEIPAGKTDNPVGPQPNPGEPFQDVYSQVYNVPAPALKDVPPDPPQPASMRGFVRNYAAQPGVTDPSKIMLGVTPTTVPVLSALAHNYALCDHWFASIPTQTFCNRSFVHAGTSSGYVNNGGGGLCFVNETPTIFNLLEDAGKSWRIYCCSWLLESFALLTQKHLWHYALGERFGHLKEFLSAAGKKGALPAYSFIEPVYFDSLYWGAENDMHPECNFYEFYGPSNLHKGELLLWKLYHAIRNGPNWDSTLLIIVFDEHGGCYDHVPPPTSATSAVAVSPDGIVIPPGAPGGAGFKFDRLGPRVPAILVSAYTPPQTRLNQVFEHTSILSTIVNRFDLPTGKLGARQKVALDLGAALALSAPRTDQPVIPKPTASLLDDLEAEAHFLAHTLLLRAKSKPVSDLQRTALHGVARFAESLQSESLHQRVSSLDSELQADTLLMEIEAKLASKRIL